MNDSPAGPGLSDWVAATFRALHPVRWAVGMVGVAITWAILPLAEPLFNGSAPDWAGWWADPAAEGRDLGAAIAERSPLGAARRLAPLLAGLGAAWCLVGGWIVRHELVARYRARPGQFDPPPPVRGPIEFVVRKAKDLALCPVIVLVLVGVTLLPLLIACWVNDWFGGVGAIFVAVLLPVVLLADLVAVLLAAGVVAWPLMPAALAAEQNDIFDALSRAYNYTFARPIRFAALMGLTIAVAGLPLAAVLGPLADAVAGNRVVVALAAGLSASLFWSLQTVIYLNLRWSVDQTDPAELADPPEPKAEPAPAAPAAPPQPAKSGPDGAGDNRWVLNVAVLPFVYGAWFLTAWLFRHSGGDDARWMDWGLADGFVPPAGGLQTVAATLALIWGIAWFLLPILVALRPFLKGAFPAGEPAAEEPKSPPHIGP